MNSPFEQTMPEMAALVGALGAPDFAKRLLELAEALTGADMISAFATRPGGVRVLFCAGASGPEFAERATLDYARRFWRSDPILPRIRQAKGRPAVIRMKWNAILDPLYRSHCYETGAVLERLTLLAPDPERAGSSLTLNLYRLRASGAFSQDAPPLLDLCGPFLVSAIRRHEQLSGDGCGTSPMFPDVVAVSQRLWDITDGRLTRREAQVCALTALGHRQSDIAHALGIAITSVATYRRRGYARLGVVGRPGLEAVLRCARPAAAQ